MAIRPQRNFARFFLVSFVLFCLFLPIWRFVSPLYAQLLASLSLPLLPQLTTGSSSQKVEFFSRIKGTTIYLVDPRGVTEANVDHAPALSFNTGQVHLNVPLLLALFCATPGLWRGHYWKQLGLALGVLFLWHASYVSMVLYRLAAQIAYADVATAGGVLRVRTDLPYEMFFNLFIPQLLPFVLWIGLIHFHQSAGTNASMVSAIAVGRNAPCPCGSSRKYKHCCGAVARTVV